MHKWGWAGWVKPLEAVKGASWRGEGRQHSTAHQSLLSESSREIWPFRSSLGLRLLYKWVHSRNVMVPDMLRRNHSQLCSGFSTPTQYPDSLGEMKKRTQSKISVNIPIPSALAVSVHENFPTWYFCSFINKWQHGLPSGFLFYSTLPTHDPCTAEPDQNAGPFWYDLIPWTTES